MKFFLVAGLMTLASASDHIQVSLDAVPVHHVPPTFLSVTMDAGQFYKGHFWHDNVTFPFESAALIAMARELGPAHFRVGGTEADTIWYDIRRCFDADRCGGEAHQFQEGLPVESIDALYTFASKVNFTVAFGLNAGHGPRDGSGAWKADNAAELVEYVAKKYPAASGWWELGNEPEAFVLGQKQFVSAKQLAADMQLLRHTVKKIGSEQRTAGIDITGTTPYIPPTQLSLLPGFLKHGGADQIDAITYHWYPLIGASAQLPKWAFPWIDAFPLEATVGRIVGEAFALTEAKMRDLSKLAKSYNRSLWLGETSSAAVGGLDGGSNRFASSLLYLFTLGQAAVTSHDAVMRQSLIGASYSLIDKLTMSPLPDFWAAVLFKKIMGSQVHAASPTPTYRGRLRLFAHCDARRGAHVSLLVINPTAQAEVIAVPEAAGQDVEAMVLLSDDDRRPLTSASVRINGKRMVTPLGGAPLPELPVALKLQNFESYTAPPYSASFLTFKYDACVSLHHANLV